MQTIRPWLCAVSLLLALVMPQSSRAQDDVCRQSVDQPACEPSMAGNTRMDPKTGYQQVALSLFSDIGQGLAEAPLTWHEDHGKPCLGDLSCLTGTNTDRPVNISFLANLHGPLATVAAKFVPECAPSDISIKLGFSDGGSDWIERAYIVEYNGKTVCHLLGYPNVAVEDGSGKAVTVPVRHGNEAASAGSAAPVLGPVAVTLSPTDRIAWFVVQTSIACDRAVKMKIALPQSETWLQSFGLARAGCSSIAISPIRPLSALALNGSS